MKIQKEENNILNFPICPQCNEIVCIYPDCSFNIKLICEYCNSNELLSVEEIEYEKISEININFNHIIKSFKNNKKIVLNKVISITTKLNYIYLAIIKKMYPNVNKKTFSLDSNEHNESLIKLDSLKKPSNLSHEEHIYLVDILRKIYFYHFLYKSIIKIYEKTGINIYINEEEDYEEIILKFKMPPLLNSFISSSYWGSIKNSIMLYLESKKIKKYLKKENKYVYENINGFSIFILPIHKYIVIGYDISDKYKAKVKYIFYDNQMKELFSSYIDICQYGGISILMRELKDGNIIISDNSGFSIYSLNEKKNKHILLPIQKLDNIDNTKDTKIPNDGIINNFFVVEEYNKIIIFEKKNSLVQKVKYSIKQIITKKNENVKSLFLNEKELLLYYKIEQEIIFDEYDINGISEDYKTYKLKNKLLKWIDEFINVNKINERYLMINDKSYIYFFNYELKQIENIIDIKSDNFMFFSRNHQNINITLVQDNIINIYKLNNKSLELEFIKKINIPSAFQKLDIDIKFLIYGNKIVFSVICLIYNELDLENRISKLFIKNDFGE